MIFQSHSWASDVAKGLSLKIFIQSDGKALGPCTIEQIQSLLAGGWISPSDLAKYEDETDWRTLSSFPEFMIKDPIASANADSSASATSAPIVDTPPPQETIIDSLPAKVESPSQPSPKPPFWDRLHFSVKLPALPKLRVPWRRILSRRVIVGLSVFAFVAIIIYLGLITYPSLNRKYRAYRQKKEAAAKAQAANSISKTNQISSVNNATLVVKRPEDGFKTVPPSSALPEIMLNSNDIAATVMPDDKPVESPTRRYIAHSVDPKATPFGTYDVGLIQAIQKHWLEILDQQDIVKGRSGRVIVEFHLSAEGKITDLLVVESAADEMLSYLCQKAIKEQSPWLPWPEELRPLVKDNYRKMRFTFYY